MKTFQQFIEEAANQISPITGKGYLVIPPVRVKDTKGMKRHIVPDFGNPNYKPPQASSSNKNDKVAQGETLKQGNTYLAQLAPLEKENQLPYKYSKYGIRTVEPSMDKLKDRVKRYGNIQRLKDIDPRYP